MTDKERLEEIKNNKTCLGGTNGLIIAINTDDYDWLIEQSERVRELEESFKALHHQYGLKAKQLRDKNQRYKQALEKIKEVTETDYSNIFINSMNVITIAVNDALEGDNS